MTCNEAVSVSPPIIALMVALLDVLTVVVVIVKVADELPAGTVTVAGAIAAAFELESAITAPPAGAEPVSVTVAVEDVPPTKLAGEREREFRPTIVRVSEIVDVWYVPLMLGIAV